MDSLPDPRRTVDYHDFTTIDTPQEERRRLNVGDLWINAIKCLECGDEPRSRNRHDCRACGCGACYVDGGSFYVRVGAKDLDRVENRCVPYNDVRDTE